MPRLFSSSKSRSNTKDDTTDASSPRSDYHLQESDSNNSLRQPSSDSDAGSYFYDTDYLREYPLMSEQVRLTLKENEQNAELSEHDKVIVQRLAMRSFHLPGNTYWQDWHAFLWNNHPFFGLTKLADHRHPFGLRERLVNLIASLAFGLAATSSVVLWFYYKQRNMNETYFEMGSSGEDWYHVDVTQGMVALLFVGGPLHVLFDFGIWFLQACPPCRAGGFCQNRFSEKVMSIWIWLGTHMALEITIVSIILCAYVIILRATLENEEAQYDDAAEYDDAIQKMRDTGIEDYAFIALYIMEVVVANFVMFPICAFTIFSGVLGCGRLPGIGGRPWQKRRWKQKQEALKMAKIAEKKEERTTGYEV